MSQHKYLGEKVKELRKSQKVTLKQLSEKTDLSIGYLSQLERGLATVAIDSLDKIAKAFDTTLYFFFNEEIEPENKTNYDLMKHHEKKIANVDKYYVQYHLLHHPGKASFLPRYYEILPKAFFHDDDSVTYAHEGEEFIYVLEGVLTVVVDHEIIYIHTGDSILITSASHHTWYNDTDKVVRLLLVHAPNPYKV